MSLLKSPKKIKCLCDSLVFTERVREIIKKAVYILRIDWSIDTEARPFFTGNSQF